MKAVRRLMAAALALLAAAAAAQQKTEAEVRKVDLESAKLTLRHERIENLDMPPMTMVFRVADPKLLEGLKSGDRVRFLAERIGGLYTVTAIEPAR